MSNYLSGKKIVLVGDLLADVWWHAAPSTRNIEHAAMALVSQPRDCKLRPGGMGIVIDALRHTGATLNIFSTVGESYEAAHLLQYLRMHHVGVDFINVDSAFVTPVKTRYLNENGHILVRHDSEKVTTTSRQFDIMLEYIVRHADLVIISDYAKGCINPKDRERIIAAAQGAGVPVLVDTKPALIPEYSGVTGFKLNRLETEQIGHTTGDIQRVMRAAFDALPSNTKLLVTTDGSAGAGYIYAGQYGFVNSPKCYSSGNCVGAGDIFFVGLIMGLLTAVKDTTAIEVDELSKAIHVGLVAAGQRVRTNGFKVFNPGAVFSEVRNLVQPFNPERKILAAGTTFCDKVTELRLAGQSVVFTNGCFDLMHEGHIKLLSWAREQGDALFVAVDSDSNVQRLKGAERPIHDERTRALNVAALEFVTGVCVFNELMPNSTECLSHLIETVRPDVLVKGADYADKVIVGQEFAGRVALCPLVPDKSTTRLVSKLRQSNDRKDSDSTAG